MYTPYKIILVLSHTTIIAFYTELFGSLMFILSGTAASATNQKGCGDIFFDIFLIFIYLSKAVRRFCCGSGCQQKANFGDAQPPASVSKEHLATPGNRVKILYGVPKFCLQKAHFCPRYRALARVGPTHCTAGGVRQTSAKGLYCIHTSLFSHTTGSPTPHKDLLDYRWWVTTDGGFSRSTMYEVDIATIERIAQFV